MNRLMKNSGIEWIGAIPAEWIVKRLKFGVKIRSDRATYTSASNSYFGLENVESYSGKYVKTDSQYNSEQALVVKNSDVLFGKLRPYLAKVYFAQEDAVCSGEFAVFYDFEHSQRFLSYQLLSHWFINIVDSSTYGAKMPRANIDFIRNLAFLYPTYIEQNKIVQYLDDKCGKIDRLIVLEEEMISELQAYKQSVITEAVTKGLDPNVSMKDTGVKWANSCPNDWEIVKLKFLCSMKSGTNLTSQDISDSDLYPVYGGNDIRGFYHTYNSEIECLLIGRQGALCGNVKYISQRIWATEHAVITIPTKYTSAKYLYYLLTAMNLNQHSVSSAQPGLSVNYVQNLTTVLPRKEEQAKITTYLDKKSREIDALVSIKYSKIETLKEYKKSLIYECVTGKRDCTMGRQEDGA